MDGHSRGRGINTFFGGPWASGALPQVRGVLGGVERFFLGEGQRLQR